MAGCVAVIASSAQWRDQGRRLGYAHRHLVRGLRAIGIEPEVVSDGPWPLLHGTPHAVFLWNGRKGRWAEYARRFRAAGAMVFVMEHGWLQRRRHVQIDPAGFGHAASWATREQFDRPAPPEGRLRFETVWGRGPTPVAPRGGNILVLLQVPGDAQLQDSEIQSPGPLVAAVEAAAPDGFGIRVRRHPQHHWRGKELRRATFSEGTLAEAVAEAAFCVTINTTAGVEALAMGCPVVCLGPAIYAAAAAAMETDLANLSLSLADAADGKCPAVSTVQNFLFHLACRQWSLDELAAGGMLRNLLEFAR